MVKIVRLLIAIASVAGAYYWNNKIKIMPAFPFTGLLILLWIVLGIIGMAITKIYKNKKGIPQEKHSYSLPDTMAKMMKKVDLRTQYESSILSTFLIMIGILSMAVYFIFFYPVGIVFKVLTGMNSLFGLMFMYSNLITVYQQYVIYMQTEVITKAGLESGEMLPADFGGMAVKVDTDAEPVIKLPKEVSHSPNDIDSTERGDSKNA